MKRREEDHREIMEAVRLLRFWYMRWQGAVIDTPSLSSETRNFIERHGEQVPTSTFIR